jgi:hypothetical protein
VNALLAVLRRHRSLLDPVPIHHISPDPDDDPFRACALEVEADFLVTGNRRHFPPAQLAGMTVAVNAAKRLEFILLGFEDDSSRQELGVELSADNPRILR